MEYFHTDYLDMILIHRPSEDTAHLLQAWRVLEALYREGKVRAIGVSNFEIPLLQTFLRETDIKPMVNQIMINPGLWHRELREFCLEQNVRPTAWSPLRGLTDDNRTLLSKIGQAYKKSWAQVLLRFYHQNGIVTVPKSHYEPEIRENLDVFDFQLTPAELAAIDSMPVQAVDFRL